MAKCPECNFATETSKSLKDHILSRHRTSRSKKLKFKCSHCNRSFASFFSVKDHLVRGLCSELNQANPDQPPVAQSDADLSDVSGIEAGAEFEASSSSLPCTGGELTLAQVDSETALLPSKCAESLGLSLEQRLQHEAVEFLVGLKELHYTTQTTVNHVICGVDNLKDTFVDILQKRLSDSAGGSELPLENALKCLEDVKGLSLFEGVTSKDDVEGFWMEEKGLVKPTLVSDEKSSKPTIVSKDGKSLKPEDSSAYCIPFLEQLEKILNCKDVLYCVDNPEESEPGLFRTVLDGCVYKFHPVRKFDKNALAVILYQDGIEITDSDSSRAGIHSLTQFYWTLGNIYPRHRSTDRTVNLLGSVKTKTLKRFQFKFILEDLVTGINKLSSEEGVTLKINGVDRVFHGCLLMVLGDTPASAEIGGFKCSHFATRPCRMCMALNPGYLKIYDISKFEMRNKETHEFHVAEVEKCKTDAASIEYGVNNRSVLMDINGFDVTKCLPQDVMHVGPEGLLAFVCRLVLKHVVDKKKMTIAVINSRVKMFAKFLKSDKPSPITEDHLAKKLRQSSSQMMALAIILPFVLRKRTLRGFVSLLDQEYEDVLLSALNHWNFCMAYEYRTEDVQRMRNLSADLHKKILVIVPDLAMLKAHFIHHLADQIILFGPLRQQSVFRFEAHHAYFKRLVTIIHNYVNILKTITTRHQIRQSLFMSRKSFLYEGHEVSMKPDQSVIIDENRDLLEKLFPGIQTVRIVTKLSFHGTVFQPGSVILINANEPKFGLVNKLYFFSGELVIVYEEMTVQMFHTKLRAYRVSQTAVRKAVMVENLLFPFHIIRIKVESAQYVIPQYHRSLLH